ncbi:MAG: ectoine hydroxylase [Gammaproteobacteria bacterium]|jgi:ectoine hydroxylase
MALAATRHDTGVDLYPSRLRGMPRLMERKDPLVYGGPGDGPLDRDQLREYADNGFLVFDNLFSASETEHFRRELVRLDSRDDLKQRPEVITEPDSHEIRSVFGIHRHQSPLAWLCRDRRIVDIARQLLGSDVYIHQSRVNYKPGFNGREFYWHSDFETWHTEDGMPRMRAVSCSISLTDNDPNNGPLMLIPGSHKQFLACIGETPEDNYRQSLRSQEIGVPDNEHLARVAREGGIRTNTGPAGSVLFFECNVMHGSNSNITPFPRSNVFMVFNSVENTVVEPFSAPRPRPDWLGERHDFSPIRPQ